jgi:hypothetical protein
MIIEKHINDYSIKSTYLWHIFLFFTKLGIFILSWNYNGTNIIIVLNKAINFINPIKINQPILT